MGFHESAVFPQHIAWDSRVGPMFRSIVAEGDAGGTESSGTWPVFRRRWNVKYGVNTAARLRELYNFIIARNGPEHGFRFPCFLDFTSASDHISDPAYNDQPLGTYDGSTLIFPLKKRYTNGGVTIEKLITKPIAGSVLIGVNGSNSSNFTVDTSTGLVTLTSTPTVGHAITAGFQYHVPSQFAPDMDDSFELAFKGFNAQEMPNIIVNEMVGDVVTPESRFHGGGTTLAVTNGGKFAVPFGPLTIAVTGPNNGAATLLLPNPATLELGFDYFNIINLLTGSSTLTVKNHTEALTVTTISGFLSSARFLVYPVGSTKLWGAAKSA